jgi:2-amino-4-hydroxy-6-hydroxymethyldihydropteridine diphosphokinase
MAVKVPGFFLGLGSNIDPDHNMLAMVESLSTHFDSLWISRVIHIPPVGMPSKHDFLNAVLYLPTALEADQLKALCNQIEMDLGRDRDDPDSKHKDRPADIDILCAVNTKADLAKPLEQITDEFFLYPLIEELQQCLADKPLQQALPEAYPLNSERLSFGKAATTIDRNGRGSDERVI